MFMNLNVLLPNIDISTIWSCQLNFVIHRIVYWWWVVSLDVIMKHLIYRKSQFQCRPCVFGHIVQAVHWIISNIPCGAIGHPSLMAIEWTDAILPRRELRRTDFFEGMTNCCSMVVAFVDNWSCSGSENLFVLERNFVFCMKSNLQFS